MQKNPQLPSSTIVSCSVQPASLQQLGGLAHVIAEVLGRGVDGVLPLGGEDLRRHLVLDLVQDLELAALRQARGRQLGVVEVAADADVEIVEQLLVGFLEVEGELEGAAHARVLELLAPQVEDERLHGRDAA